MTFFRSSTRSSSFFFLILIPEKSRIVEPRAQHPLVALPHQPVGIGIRIHHRDEVRRQLAVGIFHRQILLVMPHHGDQHFLRQVQITAIEAAKDRGRELGDVDQRVQQIGIRLAARQRPRCPIRFFRRRSSAERITPLAAELFVKIGDGHGNRSLSQEPGGRRSYCPNSRRRSRTAQRHRPEAPPASGSDG